MPNAYYGLLTSDRTNPRSKAVPTIVDRTRASVDDFADRTGDLRNRSRILAQDVAEIHSDALSAQLDARTEAAAKRSVQELLEGLATEGFSWRDIARAASVTVPAVRKWRRGEPASGTNRRSLARFAAFVEMLATEHMINDVASWMDMPIGESTLTGIDAYCSDAKVAVQYAAEQITSDGLLNHIDPDWRSKIDNRFEIMTAGDGERMIRLRTERKG